MSTGKASLEGDEQRKNSNFLLAEEPAAKKSRRGSIAAIFSPEKSKTQVAQDGKGTATGNDRRMLEKNPSLKSKASVEQYDKPNPSANDKTRVSVPTRASRKKRKTFHNINTAPTATQGSQVECLEVTQSKWVQDPADPSQEIVTLTGEISDIDSESIPYSFRWIHHQRDTKSVTFEDFEAVLARVQGLYIDEAAVALKCIREVKMKRRTFGKGKYFEPTVHEASGIMGSSVEKVPIKATFVCIPVLALMKQSEENLEYLNRQSRKPARHPIRSLLQYSNILGMDTKRDMRQVITRPLAGMEDETAEVTSFIHVPELWALVINMFTVITIAPFSRELLLRENIRIEQPPTKEQRLFVKYTSLRGRLLDLRCQSWYGLLESISKIEFHVSEIEKHLNEDDSEYKIIDLKYRPINQNKWKRIVESAGARRIDIRLVRIPSESHLTLDFAERKLTACVHATWILLGLPHQMDILELKMAKARKGKNDAEIIDALKLRIERMAQTESRIRRSRFFNRMLLYAARSHILNPRQKSDSARKAKTIRAFGRVIMASNLASVGDPGLKDSSHAAAPALYQNTLQVPEFTLRRPSGVSSNRHASIPNISTNNEPIPTFAVPPDAAAAIECFRPTSSRRNTWYEPDLEAQAPQNPSLWAAAPRVSFDRGPPASGNRILPAIVDPYSPGLSSGAMQDNIAPAGASYSNPQYLRPGSGAGRRHSSFGIPGEVLSASPLRLPLRVEGSDNLTKAQPYTAGQQQHVDGVQRQDMGIGLFQGHFGGKAREETNEKSAAGSIAERANKRATEATFGHVPFFQCQMEATQAANSRTKQAQLRQDDLDDDTESTGALTANRNLENPEPTAINAAKDILSDVDSFLREGRHDDSEHFQVFGSDYEEIVIRKRIDVILMVQEEIQTHTRPSMDIGPNDDDPKSAQQILLDSKAQLILSVHALIECFAHQEMLPATPVLDKIWGIIHNLCLHSLAEGDMGFAGEAASLTSVSTSATKHEIKFVQEAAKEVENIEFKVKELLHMHHSTADDSTGFKLGFPKELFTAFMDFVILLLSFHLAVIDHRVDSQAINIIKEKVHGALNEAHSTFLLISERVDMDLDQIGYESIRSSDTILGLIVESALNISCREHAVISGDGSEMDFNIVDLYSRYTSNCVDRAKQEASARVYEDVRLLREEIDTISMVLTHQFNTFNRIIDARESAHQTLDKRFIYRVNSNLDEMIRHFSILSNYAIQAEWWARNSIDVRSEQNNKAIYVFTAVTVIFLPLSFMTGVLGMNTDDIRTLTHGQWLFWATGIPLTLFVLVICLLIVKYKFKLKRRLRRFVLRNRFARNLRRTHGSFSYLLLDTYFHRPYMGYGLRILFPYPLYQRCMVRRTKKRMHLKEED